MEIDDLAAALEKTLGLLRESESSLYGSLSVAELIRQIEAELGKRKKSQPVDFQRLGLLFAPTSSLQEISIDNGWGDAFIEVASIVDRYTRS
jgi:hypothetical protein